MTVKEYLQQIRDIDKQIDIDMQEAARLRSLAEQTGQIISPDLVRPTGSRNMEDAVAELVDLERRVIDNIHKMVCIKDEIKGVIDTLSSSDERHVLSYRYINGMKWEEMAVRLSYSWRQMHRIHSRALKSVEKKMAHNVTQISAKL